MTLPFNPHYPITPIIHDTPTPIHHVVMIDRGYDGNYAGWEVFIARSTREEAEEIVRTYSERYCAYGFMIQEMGTAELMSRSKPA